MIWCWLLGYGIGRLVRRRMWFAGYCEGWDAGTTVLGAALRATQERERDGRG